MLRLYIGVVVLVASTNVHAYIDPGTASLILQGLLAAVATGIVTAGIYYQKVKSFFSRNQKDED